MIKLIESLEEHILVQDAKGIPRPSSDASCDEVEKYFRNCRAWQQAQTKLASQEIERVLSNKTNDDKRMDEARVYE